MTKRFLRVLLTAFGLAGWLVFSGRAVQSILSYALGPDLDSVWLYDWRVYYAGALDLLERDLYLDGGIGVGGLKMPVDTFNYPPLAAVLPFPLVPLGYEVGGLIWVVAGALALGASGIAASRLTRATTGLMVVGIFFLLYSIQPYYVRNIVLGNENSFVLPILIGFAWAHLRGHQRSAGLLLGLAVAIKVWPVMLGILLIRERRWHELGWAAGLVALQGTFFVLWLGPEVVPEILDALRTPVPIPEGVVVLWTTWARETLDWWPARGSIVLAAVLVAIPARGRLGIGFGLLAGLSLIANIWDHYLPTFAFATLLVATSDEAARAYRRLRLMLSRDSGQNTAHETVLPRSLTSRSVAPTSK